MAGDLSAEERAELERLRAQVAELQRPAAQRWRSVLSAILITLAAVLAPLSLVGVWAANEVTDTERYVENVTPLATDPAVQNAVATRVTTEIMKFLNVPRVVDEVVGALESRGLPPKVGDKLNGLSGALAAGVEGFVGKQATAVVRSDAFKTVWVEANRAASKQLNAVLSGQGSQALKVAGDTVTLDLAPLIERVKQRLVNTGLGIAASIPEIHTSIELFSGPQLLKAQTAYTWLTTLKWVLPILMLVLAAVGVYVAKNHRRALLGVGLGLVAGMLVLAAALAIGRNVYLSAVSANSLSVPAAAEVFDALITFLKISMRMLLVLGLVVVLGAFCTGPSATAVRTRSALSGGLSRAGARLPTGRFGEWVYRNRTLLRVAIVLAAVVVFVFWNRPTGLVVALLALAVLLLLAVVEFLGHRPSSPQGD
ncbi:hypothetical protein [Nonomuraea sp. NPDC046570]|uniref:hypothetical protein n=1 Tax=Nonomuraea sp. NPDC046570 TaxID=3155255 RepID=UPI0033E6C1FF